MEFKNGGMNNYRVEVEIARSLGIVPVGLSRNTFKEKTCEYCGEDGPCEIDGCPFTK